MCQYRLSVLQTYLEIVSGYEFPVTDVNVKINVTHTWDADLNITWSAHGVMISPAATAGGVNFTDTIFDDEAALSITTGVAHYGSF
jgi:hypothetical protein